MAFRVRACGATLLVPLLLQACSGAFGERARENVHQSIAAGSAPAVRIDNVAGTVRIDGWSKPIVDVQATKYGSNESELRSIAIDVARQGDEIAIATRYSGGVHGGGVRYRISVPSGASLHITNVAGAVDFEGVRGNLDVETQAGEITADAGNVAGNRSIDLRATTGAIKLTIAPGSSAKVTAESTVGDFSSDIPGVSQERRNIVGSRGEGTIGSGSARISLSTTTGAIALREK
jgi:hypothetical protein